MDVATISMPADEALAKYHEYTSALADREPTYEDRGIVLGYRALAKGRSLIDLHDVFRRCPADDQGRPRLALARAHWRRCWYRADRGGGARFAEGRDFVGSSRRHSWHRHVTLPDGTLPQALRAGEHRADSRQRYDVNLTAVVPLIPANLRPARGLNCYCVLWEAEWEAVPTDPMLIRHLYGSLYAVFACWDLTPLERAVLAGRLGEP